MARPGAGSLELDRTPTARVPPLRRVPSRPWPGVALEARGWLSVPRGDTPRFTVAPLAGATFERPPRERAGPSRGSKRVVTLPPYPWPGGFQALEGRFSRLFPGRAL